MVKQSRKHIRPMTYVVRFIQKVKGESELAAARAARATIVYWHGPAGALYTSPIAVKDAVRGQATLAYIQSLLHYPKTELQRASLCADTHNGR